MVLSLVAVEDTELDLDSRRLLDEEVDWLIRERPVRTGALFADFRLRDWLRLFIMIPGMVALVLFPCFLALLLRIVSVWLKLSPFWHDVDACVARNFLAHHPKRHDDFVFKWFPLSK